MKKKSGKKKVVVAVSGGFDPIHKGHIRLFEAAKKLGDELVVILNNDNWLVNKKGYALMNEDERAEIIGALRAVDRVLITNHPKRPSDTSVSVALLKVRPDIFANGGDRTNKNVPEIAVCEKINCRMVYGVGRGGKIQSSSWILENFRKMSGNIQRVIKKVKK